jgi:hypothetical protein
VLDTPAVFDRPGQRERHRLLLEQAIVHAQRTLAAAEAEHVALTPGDDARLERSVRAMRAARLGLAKAHFAQAEDALHGALQLSLSAQRAPTCDACDDGWRRVEQIAAGAQVSSREVVTLAVALEGAAPGSGVARAAESLARRAEALVDAARALVEERNHAYTFHTDSGFSFGEGWYVAAAAVLAGVAIQIEPGNAGTSPAEKFLNDAGLGRHLRPYRSRPRAMKQTTELVARAFRSNPAFSQQTLRAAFLGDEPVPRSVSAWIERRLREHADAEPQGRKVLLWIRNGAHHAKRNTSYDELAELVTRVSDVGLVPVLTGDALRDGPLPARVIDMILFWQDPIFRGLDGRRAQLQFFEALKERHGLVGQLGVTTAGMDGPALMGLPTVYLTDAPNVRMREWVGSVPGYVEVVRERGYLERVSRVLGAWAES